MEEADMIINNNSNFFAGLEVMKGFISAKLQELR
jgi:hypothetical protein